MSSKTNWTKLFDACTEIDVPDIDPYEVLFRLTWLRATEQWLRSPAVKGWIPSDVNLLLMLAKIEMLGLIASIMLCFCANALAERRKCFAAAISLPTNILQSPAGMCGEQWRACYVDG
jgi:hypothetical protein